MPIQSAQRAARQGLARVQVSLVRAPERVVVLLLAADHVGGGGEQLEVVGRQRRLRSAADSAAWASLHAPAQSSRPVDLGKGVHSVVIIAAARAARCLGHLADVLETRGPAARPEAA